MALEALFDAVIVKPIEIEETTYGNIIVPDVGKEKNETGEVIAIGPGKPTISGAFISTQLKIGDKVVLPTMGFTKLPYDGEEYYVGPENQILAKISETIDVAEILEETKESLTEEEIKNLSNE
ncbi:co-chaperone GroES family protein [bacterium]|jgi:chaperonin GroES|nr:co-chaperone GroES family protein [bacterium]